MRPRPACKAVCATNVRQCCVSICMLTRTHRHTYVGNAPRCVARAGRACAGCVVLGLAGMVGCAGAERCRVALLAPRSTGGVRGALTPGQPPSRQHEIDGEEVAACCWCTPRMACGRGGRTVTALRPCLQWQEVMTDEQPSWARFAATARCHCYMQHVTVAQTCARMCMP